MKVIITGSAFDTGVSIRNHIQERLNSVAKKLKSSKIHKLHLVLNKEGISFVSKIDVIDEIQGKTVLHASCEMGDAYTSVDGAIKKIQDQVIKYKDRVLKNRNHSGTIAKISTRNIKLEDVIEEYEVLDLNNEDAEYYFKENENS
jgi:putative sigma-54 modulation protein